MRRNRDNDETPWELNPANPKVQQALDAQFEVRVTGIELQTLTMGMNTLGQYLIEDMRSGGQVSGVGPQAIPQMIAGMKMARDLMVRLEQQWTDYVQGRTVSVSDMPPDPFGPGSGFGQYL